MTTRQPGNGARLRVLVVEDELLIAMYLEDTLAQAGYEVIGPVPQLRPAVDAVRNQPCDAAILDIHLADQPVFPLADMLARRGVPFVFLTGYDAANLPERFRGRPVLVKPCATGVLVATVDALAHPAAA